MKMRNIIVGVMAVAGVLFLGGSTTENVSDPLLPKLATAMVGGALLYASYRLHSKEDACE